MPVEQYERDIKQAFHAFQETRKDGISHFPRNYEERQLKEQNCGQERGGK